MASAKENRDLLTQSFDSFYPNWHKQPEKACFIPEFLVEETETAVIDQQENAQATASENDSKEVALADKLSLSKVFHALQEIQQVRKFGGIFVAKFDTKQCYKQTNELEKDRRGEDCYLQKWRTHLTKRGANPADENVLIMNNQLGIVLLVVNPAQFDSKMFRDSVDKAKMILSKLFCYWTAAETCDIDIGVVVCLSEDSPWNGEETSHVYKKASKDIKQFEKFWSHLIDVSIADHGKRNYYENSNFLQFARFVVSYRSAITISAALNALHEIHRHRPMATLSEKEPSGESVCCLNPRQLSSHLSTNKHQILSGLPGTGKTHLLMLPIDKAKIAQKGKREEAKRLQESAKIKENAEEQKKKFGQVIIVTGGKRLIRKYELQCGQRDSFKRGGGKAIIKIANNIKLDEVMDEDDFFADEMQSVAGNWLEFFEKRSKLNDVFTVVAVSGRAWATDVEAIMANAREKTELQGYFLLSLTTVVRGTINIVKYWAGKYLQNLPVPPIGHGEPGEPVVEENDIATTGGVLLKVKEHVKKFLAENFALSDIAVITFNEFAAGDIVKYLNDQDIKTSLAQQGMKDHVQVDYNNNVLSQEYPAVIVVNYYGYMGTSESTEFTALTRAIVRLVVIKKDRMKIQKEIDKVMQEPQHRTNRYVDMAAIVKEAAAALDDCEQTAKDWKNSWKKDSNTNEPINTWTRELLAANDWDQSLAELRYNILPGILAENSHFTDCRNFSELFQVLIDNEQAMHDYLLTQVPEDHPFYPYSVAHNRLSLFDFPKALHQIDIKDLKMRETLINFREHYLESLKIYLDTTSLEDRKKNRTSIVDKPMWQAITRAMFTLG